MKVNKLQDKLDQLYKGVDPTDRKHDDKLVLRDERVKFGVRQAYSLGTYELRSPGNDLLDFYDNAMLDQDPTGKSWSYIPPSLVYKFRFDYKFPNAVLDKKNNFGKYAYLAETLENYKPFTQGKRDDKTYYHQILELRYTWLVDKPHKSYTFELAKDLKDFTKSKFGQQVNFQDSINVGNLITQRENLSGTFYHMNWRGKLAGWSVIFTPKNKLDSIWKRFKERKIQKYQHKKLVKVNVDKILLARKKIILCDKGIFFGGEAVAKAYKLSYDQVGSRVRDKKNKRFVELSKQEYNQYCEKNNIKKLL